MRSRLVFRGPLVLVAPLLVMWTAATAVAGEAGEQNSAPALTAALALTTAMERYFDGELAEGYAWMAVGNASLVGGGALLAQDGEMARGASYPMLVVGAVQTLAGVWVLGQTAQRVAAQRRAIGLDAAGWQKLELRRLERLHVAFLALKVIEYAALATGAALVTAGVAVDRPSLLGTGLGLGGEAVAMLLLDGWAERRNARYAEIIRGIHVAIALDPRREAPALSPGLVVSLSGRF